jgi:hypothetical protein
MFRVSVARQGAGTDLPLGAEHRSLQLSGVTYALAQRWLWLNRRQDHSGSALDHFEAFGEQRCIPSIELDVIRRSCSHLQSDGMPHDECDRFSLSLTNSLRGTCPPIAAMEEFVRLCCAQHNATNSAIISISRNLTSRTRGTRAVSTRELRSFTIMREARRGSGSYGRQCLGGGGGLIGRGQGGAPRASHREKGQPPGTRFGALAL